MTAVYGAIGAGGVLLQGFRYAMKHGYEAVITIDSDGQHLAVCISDFLRELDKDRTEKKCEYAVLVSLLEAENELYNAGIVDVSHKYPNLTINKLTRGNPTMATKFEELSDKTE